MDDLSSYREALRGAEERIFDLAARHFSAEEWREWLKVPLEQAACYEPSTLAPKLARAGASIGHSLDTAIILGREHLVNILLAERLAYYGKKTWDSGDPPLHTAAAVDEPSSERIMRALLRAADGTGFKADKDAINEQGFTPLQVAAKYGHAAQVGVLLSAGADTTIRRGQPDHVWDHSDDRLVGLSALDMAATLGHVEVIKVMLDHGVDANFAHSETGSTALHEVANAPSGRVTATKLLVGAGVEINKQTVYGETALHWAAIRGARAGSADAVDALLRCGADETLLDNEDATAFDGVGCFAPDTDDEEEEEAKRRSRAQTRGDAFGESSGRQGMASPRNASPVPCLPQQATASAGCQPEGRCSRQELRASESGKRRKRQ